MILINFKGTKINGTSSVDEHKDWIPVDSMQMGVGRGISVSGTAKDREVSNPSMSEISFSKVTDISSTDLWMQATCGKSLGDCEIHFMQTGGADVKQQPYLIIILTEAIVSSYSMSSGGERPSESFSINFTKISYQYNEFDGAKVTTGTAKIWDLKNNAKG